MQMNRQFEIIYILLHRKSVTAKELAAHFGISPRTIYRDIDVLSLAGIPIYTEKGRGGGIHLLPDFVLNKAILSEKEQNEILTALQGFSSITTKETDSALQKLSALFNKNDIPHWLDVDFSDWGFSNENVFQDLKNAILNRKIVHFHYLGTLGEKTHRRIEPIQLWFKSKAWYLKGFCLTRQDMRVFKLTRITDLLITDEFFTERDTSSMTPDPQASIQPASVVTLTLKIDPEMAYRIYDEFDAASVEMQPDGSFLVTATWPEDGWLYGTLLSYQEYITVLKPEPVRQLLLEKAREIVKKYNLTDHQRE